MNSQAYKLNIINSFEALPASCVELLQQESSPFLDQAWFHSFSKFVARALGSEKWLVLSSNQSAVGLLPLIARKKGRLNVLQSMSNYYSPYFSLISAEMDRATNLQLIARLGENFFKHFDLIEIFPNTGFEADQFSNAFDGKGWFVHRYMYSTNWRELGITGFGAYWDGRPSKLRQTVKRKIAKLKSATTEVKIISRSLTDKALADFHNIYFLSWKVSEPFPAFIDEVCTHASHSNKLRMGILYINDKPAAAQIWMVSGDIAYIVKLAYDPCYAQYSAGTILSYEMFRHVIEKDGVTTIDYLTGNDNYKSQWMATSRPLYGLAIANTGTIRGLTTSLRYSIGNLVHPVRSGVLVQES